MRIPDLSHMIQVEELHACDICIHCGEKQAMHNLVYLHEVREIPGGRVVWRCHSNQPDTFESAVDAST